MSTMILLNLTKRTRFRYDCYVPWLGVDVLSKIKTVPNMDTRTRDQEEGWRVNCLPLVMIRYLFTLT